jgi:peptidoglycan/xylan/chitin deacetylase (PgdA/CDA1 family)
VADTLVLCYHAVSPSWTADLSVTPEELERQLGWLVRRGYAGVTFTEGVTTQARGRRVAVTFDDAYVSVVRYARPILDRLGLPGTVFAVTRWAQRGGRMQWDGIAHWGGTPHAAELEGMDWAALRKLRESGWEVGSHTVSHPRLIHLDDDALGRELEESRQACEQALGEPCRSIAYPYGDVDERVVGAARAAGYDAGASLLARSLPSRPLDWVRVGVWHTDSFGRYRVKVSPVVRQARRRLGR